MTLDLVPASLSVRPELSSIASEPRPHPRASVPWRPPPSERLARFSQGLLCTGLLDDLRASEPFTLLAPVDDAFEGMPFSYDALLFDERLVEARFDLFEYLVVRGTADAEGPRTAHATLHGEPVRLGRGLAFGRFGAARVLRSFVSGPALVHVLDQVLFPVYPRLYMVDRSA